MLHIICMSFNQLNASLESNFTAVVHSINMMLISPFSLFNFDGKKKSAFIYGTKSVHLRHLKLDRIKVIQLIYSIASSCIRFLKSKT